MKAWYEKGNKLNAKRLDVSTCNKGAAKQSNNTRQINICGWECQLFSFPRFQSPSGLGRGPSFQTLTQRHSCNKLMTSSHLLFPLDDTLPLPSADQYWFATMPHCYIWTVLIRYFLHSACLPVLHQLLIPCSIVWHQSYYIFAWWNWSGEKRNAYKVLAVNPEGRRQLGMSRNRR
jgi:hypothetical protein